MKMMTMSGVKCATLVAVLFWMVLYQCTATDGPGFCKGRPVYVFLNSSYLTGGDVLSPPDTYIKMRIGEVTQRSKVIPDQNTAIFKTWFFFGKAQSDDLQIEAWDFDGVLDPDDLMGTCVIKLNKPISEERCTFPKGEVSLTYICI